MFLFIWMFIFIPQIRRGTKQNEQINSHSFGEKTHDPSECDRFKSNTRRSETLHFWAAHSQIDWNKSNVFTSIWCGNQNKHKVCFDSHGKLIIWAQFFPPRLFICTNNLTLEIKNPFALYFWRKSVFCISCLIWRCQALVQCTGMGVL